MKKHIFGLAIFSFIFGAAAIGYALFINAGNIGEVVIVNNSPTYSVESCWKMKQELKSGSPPIRQATLSVESGLFIFEIGCVEKTKQISLYFYEKDEKNTRLIATEEINLKSSINCENNSSLYKNFSWAKDFNRNSNIYVIARTSDKGEKSSTNFNESLAVPVLIAARDSGISSHFKR